MVRPILLACGTRGDTEPFLTLASALVERSDVECVKLLMPEQYKKLAPSHGKLQVIGMENMTGGIDQAVSIDDPLALMGQGMAQLVLPSHIRAVEDAREMKADIVVSGLPTLPLGVLISAVLGAPLVFVQFQPLLPSSNYSQINRFPAEAALAFAKGGVRTSVAQHKSAAEAVLAPSVDALVLHAARYGIPPPSLNDLLVAFGASAPTAHALLAYPETLAPRPSDAPSNACSIGPLAANYIPQGWKPAQQLAEFVTKEEKPVILAFSSMPPPDGSILLHGLRSCGIKRIVVVGNIIGMEHKPNDGVYVAHDNVQYAWLFRHAEFVISSGGAGTVASGLAAGVPLMVAPVMMDQHFWAAAVEINQVGVHLREIKKEAIGDAVKSIRRPEITEAAHAMATRSSASQNAPARAAEQIVRACVRQ